MTTPSISDLENLQIDNSILANEALKKGIPLTDVETVTKGDSIATEVPSPYIDNQSEFDEQKDNSIYVDGTSEFDNRSYLPYSYPKQVASRKALYTTLASNGSIETYQDLYTQLADEGNTFSYDVLKEEVNRKEKEDYLNAIEDTAAIGDTDSVQTLLEAAPTILGQRQDPSIKALENVSQTAIEASMGNKRIEDNSDIWMDNLEDWSTIRDKIYNSIILPEIAKSDPEISNYITDVADFSFLGEQTLGLSKVGKDFFGEYYLVQGGNLYRDLAQLIRNQPDEGSKLQMAKKVVESITEHAGVLKDNDYVKTYALDTLNDFLKSPGGDDPTLRWLVNVFGAVDLISIIPAATGVKFLKWLKKIRVNTNDLRAFANPLSELADVSPELDSILTSRAIRSEEDALSVNLDPNEQLRRVMPKSMLDDEHLLEGAPEEVVEKYNGIKTTSEEIIDYADNTFSFAPEAYRVKQVKIESVFNDIKDQVEALPSKFNIVRSNNKNSHILKAVYGDSRDGTKILTLEKAEEISSKLKKAFEDEDISVSPEIYVKNKNTGLLEKFNSNEHIVTRRKLKPRILDLKTGRVKRNFRIDPVKITNERVSKLRDDLGGFVVSVKQEVPMSRMDIVPGQTTGEGATKGWGFHSRWYVNPTTYMNSRVLAGARIANDQKDFLKHDLFKLITPLTNLSYFNKKRVANLLELGDRTEEVFSYKQLNNRGYSDKVIEGYMSARILEDAMYRVKNYTTRESLKNQGYKSLHINRGSELEPIQNGVKIVEKPNSLSDTVKRIFDPYQGKGVVLNDGLINSLDEQGLKIAKTLRNIDTGEHRYNYILVKNSDVSELPEQVFPYRKGHIFRINKDPYFIDKVYNVMEDGVAKRVNKTIAVAETNSKAKKAVDKYNFENTEEGVSYRLRIDRNFLKEESILKSDIDALDSTGPSFWFSKRGDRLKRVLSSGEDSLVEDPLTALDKSTSSVANVISHGKWIENESEYHRKTYGHLLGNNDKPLWYWDDISSQWRFDKKAAEGFDNSEVRAALHHYEYLEDMKYTPISVDIKWRRLMAEIDGVFGNLGDFASGVSKKLFLDTLGSTSPNKFTRGAAFALTIPLKPFRHIVLQGSTGLYLSGIDSLATVKSFRDAGLMLMSFAAYQNKSWPMVRKMAKLYGYTEEEWEDVFNTFRKSGKAYSIDSHVAVGESNFSWSRSIPETPIGEAARVAGNILKSPISIGKQVGFDVGEFNNQAMTWLFAKRIWEKANPGLKFNSSQKYLDEINAAARNYSVDMTNTDAFRYQKGAFSSMTQFMAIHNKMFMRVTGLDNTIKGVNRLDTAKKRGKFLLALMAIYGTASLGLQGFYDSWKKENDINVHPQVDAFLFGGLSQLLVDNSIDLVYGNPLGTTRTSFSDSFSPSGGIVRAPLDFAVGLMDGNFLEALAGPSGSQFPNIAKAATVASQVWGFEDLNTYEKIGKSIQVAAEEFGIFSDYFKYNIAMAYKDKLNELYIVNKDGRPVAHANSIGEIWANTFLGAGTRSTFELYNKWFPSSKEFRSFGGKKSNVIDKDAKELSKWLYREWAKSDGDWFKFSERAQAITFSLFRGNEIYGWKVYNQAKKYFELDPQFSKFIESFAADFQLADPKADLDGLVNYIRSSDYVPEQDKEHLVDSINQWEISREIDKELIERLKDK